MFGQLKFLWFRSQVTKAARANAFHHLTGRGEQVIMSVLGPPPAGPTQLLTPTPDVSREQSRFREVCHQLAVYWWWPCAPILILGLLAITWRADVRLFLITGWPTVDALLFGAMLTTLAVLLTWAFRKVWHRPYDGTGSRTRALVLVSIAYFALIASIVAIRIGQGDPNEPWYVRAGSAGLTVAATVGPAVALELLASQLFIVAPLLQQRSALQKTINAAIQVDGERHTLAQRTDEWQYLSNRLSPLYEIEYERYTLRYTKEE